ncbi:hypothetical protein DASC09_053700 [Saccharomycopsis crataegensis]|uniref:EamA domain-containing protein n=1 Tax=Saccharomycopsis crataegensis TaxID=43959 RepID=A0AAV5QV26_9ASCO|nr:hypothetical protein DASC09_053700 [Saccharomycopsis crataegensis]
MAETGPLLVDAQTTHSSSDLKKFTLVVSFFVISLISFLGQTEVTQYIYSSPKYQFNQPYFLLFLTHGSWMLLWPIQLVGVGLWNIYHDNKGKYLRLEDIRQADYFKGNLQQYIRKEIQSAYKISEIIYNHHNGWLPDNPHISQFDYDNLSFISFFSCSAAVKYIIKRSLLATLIITTASITWYVAMIYSYSNDVTAIYNCCAFFAYLFSIPLLKEQFSWLKISSVTIAISGVFMVVYSGNQTEESTKSHRFFGNILISLGSICYGYYDVYYKKYLCVPHHSHRMVDSKQQTLYSNFICSLIGGSSVLILSILIVFIHVSGLKKFSIDYPLSIWFFVSISVLCNLLYSSAMLVLYALTSPVLGAVSSLTTIFLVGMFEWLVFGNGLNGFQLFGDVIVIVGFGVLSYAYWKEIVTEDNGE